jgi:ribosome-binding protein aMBF1 (putative translation factor)
MRRLYFLTDDVVRRRTRRMSEEPITVGSPEKEKTKPEKEKAKVEPNNVRKVREGLLLSKAELARRAKISVLTIDRVEKGMACRMDTKRKIILSLGLKLSDRNKVFHKV